MPQSLLPFRLRHVAAFGMAAALSLGSIVLFSGNSNGRATQANQGNTGAPGEGGQTCGNCHNGGSFGPVSGMLSILDASGNPVSAWQAGETYDVQLDIAASGSPSGYGFQLTALDGSDQQAGSLAAGSSNTKTASISSPARTYAEHNGVGSSSTFTVSWTAPSAGAGSVTFYYSGNAVNGANGSANDNSMPGTTFSLPEFGATVIGNTASFDPDLTLFPNPAPNGVVDVRGEWLSTERPFVELLDASGRTLRQFGQVDGNFQAELSGASSGVHYLRFSSPTGVHTEPVQVLR
jgi:hypothetical protein